MEVRELNRDQLTQLKQAMLVDRNNAEGRGTSYGELVEADETISDEEVFAEYYDCDFSEDDFCCTLFDDKTPEEWDEEAEAYDE